MAKKTYIYKGKRSVNRIPVTDKKYKKNYDKIFKKGKNEFKRKY